MTKRKRLAILGSTGSVGKQVLEIVAKNSDEFEVVALMAKSNSTLLLEQYNRFNPSKLFVSDNEAYITLKGELTSQSTLFKSNSTDFIASLTNDNIDLVVNALPSVYGYEYSYYSLFHNVDLALANKESILLAGELITDLSKTNGTKILPLDSEASAIHQCLLGEKSKNISKIYLTASGGPFYKKSIKGKIEKKDVLNHPIWNMGQKISVDSATMMNKAFEVYELHKLFNIPMERIDVVIHPESTIHSMIQFNDGNIKALAASPDMIIPINYALHYPERKNLDAQEISFPAQWNFDPIVEEEFKCFQLALKYLKKGKSYPSALCAINDTIVNAYLEDKISFEDICPLLTKALTAINVRELADLKDVSALVKDCQDLCSGLLK